MPQKSWSDDVSGLLGALALGAWLFFGLTLLHEAVHAKGHLPGSPGPLAAMLDDYTLLPTILAFGAIGLAILAWLLGRRLTRSRDQSSALAPALLVSGIGIAALSGLLWAIELGAPGHPWHFDAVLSFQIGTALAMAVLVGAWLRIRKRWLLIAGACLPWLAPIWIVLSPAHTQFLEDFPEALPTLFPRGWMVVAGVVGVGLLLAVAHLLRARTSHAWLVAMAMGAAASSALTLGGILPHHHACLTDRGLATQQLVEPLAVGGLLVTAAIMILAHVKKRRLTGASVA